MSKEKTKIEMLCWGVGHIAENHKMRCSASDFAELELVYIHGNNLPTLFDVRELCKDLGISLRRILSTYSGISVCPSKTWLKKEGRKPYVKGVELWRSFAR